MDLVFTEHAAFQRDRRGILLEWIEEALASPGQIEIRGGKRSFLKCHKDGQVQILL